jgi:methyl-accepting chemotaxis protein
MLVIALLGTVIGFVSIFSMKKLENNYKTLIEKDIPIQTVLWELDSYQNAISTTERGVMLKAFTDDIRKANYNFIYKYWDYVKGLYKKSDELVSFRGGGEKWEIFKQKFDLWIIAHEKFMQMAEEYESLLEENKIAESQKAYRELAKQSIISRNTFVDSENVLLEVIKDNEVFVKDQVVLMNKSLNKTFTLLSIIMIVTLLLACIIGYLSANKISNRIKKVVKYSKELSMGNININISNKDLGRDSNDETIILMESFNKMKDNISYQATAINRVSNGDLDFDMKVLSDKDLMGNSINKMIENIKEILNEINKLKEDILDGYIDEKMESENLKGSWSDMILNFNESLEVLSDNLENMPLPFISMGKDFEVKYMNKKALEFANITRNDLNYGKKCYDIFRNEHCQSQNCGTNKAIKLKSSYKAETEIGQNDNQKYIQYISNSILDKTGEVRSATEIIIDQSKIKKNEIFMEKVSKYQDKAVKKLQGNIDDLKFGKLSLVRGLDKFDKELESVATNYIQIKDSLNETISNLNSMLKEIFIVADQVATSSDEIAKASSSMAREITEQSAANEEIVANIENVQNMTQKNFDMVEETKKSSDESISYVNEGTMQMEEMLTVMNEINEASLEVSKIITTIQEIANQTNLLSLNAAVEAARAGEHGKGFAVVADEVKELARRSSKSAKETESILRTAIDKSARGKETAKRTKEAFINIKKSFDNVENFITKITESSQLFAEAINEITLGLQQLAISTETNTATVQENTAASEELASQADSLKGLIEKFETYDEREKLRVYNKFEEDEEEYIG